MLGAVTAEFRKFFTTRMWWGMAIGVFLAGASFSVLFALVVAGSKAQGGPGASNLPAPGLDNTAMVSTVYTAGLSLAYLLTLVVGVMSIGSEYRHKTITSTFLSTPKRIRVMVAKVSCAIHRARSKREQLPQPSIHLEWPLRSFLSPRDE